MILTNKPPYGNVAICSICFESAVDASDAAIIDLMFNELEDFDNLDGKDNNLPSQHSSIVWVGDGERPVIRCNRVHPIMPSAYLCHQTRQSSANKSEIGLKWVKNCSRKLGLQTLSCSPHLCCANHPSAAYTFRATQETVLKTPLNLTKFHRREGGGGKRPKPSMIADYLKALLKRHLNSQDKHLHV